MAMKDALFHGGLGLLFAGAVLLAGAFGGLARYRRLPPDTPPQRGRRR
jgi:hypothetical protein